MSKETMHNVSIDVVDRTFDKEMNTVDETRVSAFGEANTSGIVRVGGTTKLVSVLKAYEQVRTKANVKGNLNNLEVQVDGVNFPG